MANIVEIILRGHDQATAAFGKATRSMKDFQTASLAVIKAVAGFAVIGTGALAGVTAKAFAAADEMGKMAQKTGFAVLEFSKLAFAAELSDVELAGLKTGLVQFSKAIVESAGNITSKQARAFQAMGVSLRDANGGLRGNRDLLLDVSDKFNGYADGAQKSALATVLFGKSGADLIPLLNAGSEEIRKMGENTIGVTDEMARNAEAVRDNMKILQQAIQNVGLSVLRDAGPRLAEFSAWLVKIQKESNAFGAVSRFLLEGIIALARGVALITFLLSQVWTEARAFADLLATTVTEAVFAVIDSFRLLGAALAGIGTAFKQFFTGEFKAAIQTAKDAVANFGPDVIARLRAADQGIAASAADIFDHTTAELEKRRAGFENFLADILRQDRQAPGVVEAPLEIRQPTDLKPAAPLLQEVDANTQLNKVLQDRQKILADIALLNDEGHARQISHLAELQTFHQTFATIVQTAHAGWLSFLATTSQGVLQGLSGAITNIVTGAQKAAEAFKNLGRQMIAMVVNFMAQKIIAFALEKVLAAASLGLQKAATASTVAAASSAASAWAVAATAALIGSYGTAAAFAALLPPAMIANAALASSLALASGTFGAAHGGLDFVPQQSTFLLSRGERVVQPAANRDLTEFLDGAGSPARAAPTMVQIYLDGSVLAEAIGDMSRDGRLQIHPRAVA